MIRLSNSSKGIELTVYLDYIPNLIKSGITEPAENYLKNRFQEELTKCIVRWGQLPTQLVQIKYFEPMSTQARSLYINGYFVAALALCGMAVEALCISVANERVQDEELKKKLLDPSGDVRKKIEQLEEFFKIEETVSLLHQVLDIRKEYLHLHKKVTSEIALECLEKLHLAVFGEYGLIPYGQSGTRYTTKKDVEEAAKRMGVLL